ncbi:flavin reductase family protein [Deminuibacter soli]|uniref:Flavin reductase family protein n=1 Tax=Deminuibacter soli TaxID=2291815 RepID=A0A3E1NR70_9BACT|nr:flavin reductase family protein [Deminuibacter soli]RFM30432.1 flavin reductase family protein [Deminuibacter soli]
MKIDIQQLSAADKQQWLQYAIAPRPICLASTIDAEGRVNLSPFSFFNMFSTDPAVVIFSPSRRVRDNTTKHTLENVLEVPEVVIHICDYDMVQQISLSSCEYPKGTDEFIKAGFTKEPATLVRPPMVKEAKIKMECRVLEVKSLGEKPGAGQLVLAEILCMHVSEEILNAAGRIDQLKLQLVARLGGDWYCAVNERNLFQVAKPNVQLGIGIDNLPPAIRNSAILTGNNLGQLANVHSMPTIDPAFYDDQLKNIFQYYSLNPDDMEKELHLYAKQLLSEGAVEKAWQVLLAL